MNPANQGILTVRGVIGMVAFMAFAGSAGGVNFFGKNPLTDIRGFSH